MNDASTAWSPAFGYALRLWRRDADAAAAAAIDASAFARTLAQHRLALALPAADTLDAGVPEALRAALRTRQRRMTMHALRQTAALRGIVASLRAAGLRHCLLKGQGYAALFDARQREACDIDLLVVREECGRALPLLRELGYVPDPAAAADPERYANDNHALPLRHATTGVVLELHLRLANQPGQFRLTGPALWNEHTTTVTLAGLQVTTLAPPAAVVYAAFHGTKHNWHRAFWLVDMAQAMRSATLDWGAALALARGLGIERQLAMGVLLAEATLGAALPPALRAQAPLLRSARRAADALLPHLDALGSDRGADLAARLGMVRYALRLLSLQSTWRGRLQLIPFLLAPTQDDRSAVALPGHLHWAYPGLRALRLARQHLAKRRHARRERPQRG
ncbi:nucleotidyltransferase family protein [Xanthomonas theicola]|uniref:nucleotidyltransferase family protein n=1 Tax=Xanthomonas theicola TaxID=56464 RepID=UPI001FE58649|nr:nucleotidyltransferase family protein [Xanthomonas theicola]